MGLWPPHPPGCMAARVCRARSPGARGTRALAAGQSAGNGVPLLDWPGVEGAVSPGGTNRGSPGPLPPGVDSLAMWPLCPPGDTGGTSSGSTPADAEQASRCACHRLPRSPLLCLPCITGGGTGTPGSSSPWRVEAWLGESGFLQVLRGFRAWSVLGTGPRMAVDRAPAGPGPPAHAPLWPSPAAVTSNQGCFPYSLSWLAPRPRPSRPSDTRCVLRRRKSCSKPGPRGGPQASALDAARLSVPVC